MLHQHHRGENSLVDASDMKTLRGHFVTVLYFFLQRTLWIPGDRPSRWQQPGRAFLLPDHRWWDRFWQRLHPAARLLHWQCFRESILSLICACTSSEACACRTVSSALVALPSPSTGDFSNLMATCSCKCKNRVMDSPWSRWDMDFEVSVLDL